MDRQWTGNGPAMDQQWTSNGPAMDQQWTYGTPPFKDSEWTNIMDHQDPRNGPD